jgi:hypothetical protein
MIPTASIPASYRQAFKVAEQFAQDTLFGTALGFETALPDQDETIAKIARMVGNPADIKEAERLADGANIFLGDIEAAYKTAGLLVGLALGLRMRGSQ